MGCHPESGYTPRRVIDIGLFGDPPKLLLGEDAKRKCGASGESLYATLSHCWGQAQQWRTTAETEHAFLQKIPRSVIPKTYEDALEIARSHEIPYLWIGMCYWAAEL